MTLDNAQVRGERAQQTEQSEPAIRLRGVRKRFGSTVALGGVDLDIGDGEFFSLLGPSGSGKTTLLRVLSGFEQPSGGTIALAGRDVTRLAPFDRDVNTVFQDYALFPHMRVLENVAYGLRVKRVGKRERNERAAEALRTVRLADYGSRKPNQLSGGQRQRVALARALVNRPRVLLLDEPLGALDLKLRQAMQLELKELQREVGITFVFVTHDQEEALTMSDRIAVVNNGQVEQIGSPAEIYESPATKFVADFVGTSNLLQGDVAQTVVGADGAYSIRPEKIRIHTDLDGSSADETTALGTIRNVVFTGPTVRYVVALDAGTEMTVLRPNDTSNSLARVSDRVRLSWSSACNFQVADNAG